MSSLSEVESVNRKRSWGEFASSRYGGPNRLSKMVPVSRRTLQNYSYKVKNRLVLKDEGGRPRSIDGEGVEKLCEFLNSRGRVVWKVLVGFVIELQRQSWCRYRNIMYNDSSEVSWPKRISRRSILRYLETIGYSRENFD